MTNLCSHYARFSWEISSHPSTIHKIVSHWMNNPQKLKTHTTDEVIFEEKSLIILVTSLEWSVRE